MKPLKPLLATLFTASLMVPAAQANLLSNGSFESPDLTAGYCYLTTAGGVPGCAGSLSGWTGGTPVIQSGNAAWGGRLAQSGEQFVGLQYFAANNIYGSISQTLNLSAGLYTLSWYDSGRAGFGGATEYDVLFNGTVVNHQSVAIGRDWQQHSISFVASGAGTLSLRAVGGTAADSTAFIDNLSLKAVPEPASLALVAVALAGMGAARCRRRA